jgi:hypothetical protein
VKRHQVTRRLAVNLSTVLNHQHLECDAAVKMLNGTVRVIRTRMGWPKSTITFISLTPIHFGSRPSPTSAPTDDSTSRCPASRFPLRRVVTTAGVDASSLPRPAAGTDGAAIAPQHSRATATDGGAASRGSKRAAAADGGAAPRVFRRAVAAVYGGATAPPRRSAMHAGGSSVPHHQPHRPPVRSAAPQPRCPPVPTAPPPRPHCPTARIAKSHQPHHPPV